MVLKSTATVLLATCALVAPAHSGEVTVWAWNIAASALEGTAENFEAANPGTDIVVEDLGFQQVFDKAIAGCAAGGAGLPDIVAVANENAENFWSQYPDCFVNLKTLGYTEEEQAGFPDFKRTELENGDIAYAMPWDSGPVAMFYRRDLYEAAGVDPVSITTWDDFIAAGKQISAANPGVVMGQADFNGDSEWFRMLSNEQGCGYFAPDGTSITINQPGCVLALTKIKEMKDAGTLSSANWDGKIQANQAGTVASQLFGAWYEGTIRTSDPEGLGKWGVYLMPSLTEDGPRAANLGGSALALTSASDVPEEAYAFLHYTLATNEGQVTMLKEFGLVPSLLSALEDPFVSEGLDYWGGQKIWQEILATLPKIRPDRGTPFKGDAESILRATQTRFLNGEYTDAKAALDDAANQISNATGLPVAQ